MSRITAIAATALCCLLAGLADDRASIYAEEMSILQFGEAIEIPTGPGDEYAEVTDGDATSEPQASDTYPPVADYDRDGMAPFAEESCSEVDGCCERGDSICCETCNMDRHGHWIGEVGASALQSQMATSDFDDWPDEFGPAGRITLGYEWANGLGIRSQAWGYSMEGDARQQIVSSIYWDPLPYYYDYYYQPGSLYNPYPLAATSVRRIELSAATAYLDFYKSIHSRFGELAIGMGPAFGNLEFNFQPAGDGSKYYGGGLSVFGQGSLPLLSHDRWELALTGRSRFALLAGNWQISGLYLGAETEHSNNMSILELSVGPELRCKIGRNSDRSLFLQTLAEFQQWRSDRMGPLAGDTLGLQGVTMNLGMLW